MRLRVVTVIVMLALGLLAVPLASDAQQVGKVARIGYLSPVSPGSSPQLVAFQQGLAQLGWVEGENLAIEYRWAEGRLDQLPDLAAELVRLKMDVIVTWGPAILAAQRATGTIPIVMASTLDAVQSGFVASLARPGGNITGLSFMNPELTAKRLELLKELVPRVSRVVGLWDPTSARDQVEEAKRGAQALRLHLAIVEARGPTDLDSAFRAAKKERAQALYVFASPIFVTHRQLLIALAAKNRLPAMYESRTFVASGGLVSYGPNFSDLYRRAATYVDKIQKGAKPADLPVEQPTRFELVINMKTAKAVGLTIPPSVLIRADHLIQ